MQVPKEIKTLIEQGALFVVNHSGGKDSQAMHAELVKIIPHSQMVIVHADLPGVDWEGIPEHIKATTKHPLHIVRAEKTLLGMVEKRGMFPSAKYRQCTSDLKRGPVEKWIRAYLKEHPEYAGRIVNCMGIRAQESPARAKQTPYKMNARNSKACLLYTSPSPRDS